MQSQVSPLLKEHFQVCFGHLQDLVSQVKGKEETHVIVKLHLLNNPARFLTSRLLDPHCLGYSWPFGGLYFTFRIKNEESESEIKSDHIFIEGGRLNGAKWSEKDKCLTEEGECMDIGVIQGIPVDKRSIEHSEEFIDIPVFSILHSEELFKVKLKVGRRPKEYWQRKNIFIRLQ